jgi:hypothetical protein
MEEAIANDSKENPSCSYSTSLSECTKVLDTGSGTEVLLKAMRHCPGMLPVEVYHHKEAKPAKQGHLSGNFRSSSGSMTHTFGLPGLGQRHTIEDIFRDLSELSSSPPNTYTHTPQPQQPRLPRHIGKSDEPQGPIERI